MTVAAKKPTIAVAKRGTYCDASVPDSSYFKAHPCDCKRGLERFGREWYCVIHARMKREGRLK